MNYSDRDNGVLPSNTPHSAPLERGNLEMLHSIDIEDFYRTRYSLVWSSGSRKGLWLVSVACWKNYSCKDNGVLSSNTRSKPVIERKTWVNLWCTAHIALLWSAEIWTYGILLTLRISIALAIHSFDPLDRGKRLRLERVTCWMNYSFPRSLVIHSVDYSLNDMLKSRQWDWRSARRQADPGASLQWRRRN